MSGTLGDLLGLASGAANAALAWYRSQDTRTPGFVAPAPQPPDDDLVLDVVLQGWIVGLTGLPGNLVRPRWQPAPPAMPDQGTNWCAIGVMTQEPDANETMVHDPAGDGGLGNSTMQRHEEIEALASFYGTNAAGYAGLVRDSSRVGQNRDALDAAAIKLVGTGTIRVVPDLINQIWVRRADISITLRRQVTRTYPVRTLVSAQYGLSNDSYALPLAQQSPPGNVSAWVGTNTTGGATSSGTSSADDADFAETVIGDGTASTFTVTHGLGSTDVSVEVRDPNDSNAKVPGLDNTAPTENTVQVILGAPLPLGKPLRIIVKR